MAGVFIYVVSMIETERTSLDPAVYEALWLYSNDLVSIVGADGTLYYVSPSYTRTLGYQPDELIGTTIFDRAHPADAEGLRVAFDLDRAGSEPASARFHYRHKNGSWRVLSVTGSNHLDDPVVRGGLPCWRRKMSRACSPWPGTSRSGCAASSCWNSGWRSGRASSRPYWTSLARSPRRSSLSRS